MATGRSIKSVPPGESGHLDGAGKRLKLPSDLRYIAVEGVIGVGKTSLANHLADRFGGGMVLEEVDENPFLPAFYSDPERWAFHTQLSYLASRFRQQKELHTRDLFHGFIVSDYTFDKDRIFAHQNLTGDELQLYETLYGLMATTIPQPDLVVYLQANLNRVMANIKKRARPYEKQIEQSYLSSLVDAYDFYFARYEGPLIRLNVTKLDFVGNPEDREQLVDAIVNFQKT
jgi:deoxyguanosine kinase